MCDSILLTIYYNTYLLQLNLDLGELCDEENFDFDKGKL